MHAHSSQIVQPLIALIAGLSIMLASRGTKYIVALYLTLIGLLGLAHYFFS